MNNKYYILDWTILPFLIRNGNTQSNLFPLESMQCLLFYAGCSQRREGSPIVLYLFVFLKLCCGKFSAVFSSHYLQDRHINILTCKSYVIAASFRAQTVSRCKKCAQYLRIFKCKKLFMNNKTVYIIVIWDVILNFFLNNLIFKLELWCKIFI